MSVELTRRGEPVAVLVGRQEFERLTSRRCNFSDAWREFSQGVDLAELALDPEELFGDTREAGSGREVRL